jgi:hypothetical protein
MGDDYFQSSFGRTIGGANRLGVKVAVPLAFVPVVSNPACGIFRAVPSSGFFASRD